MNETLSVMEPMVFPRAPKTRGVTRELRREVHNMLRDVAFVLAQTRRVKEEILEEHASQQPAE